MKSWRPSLSALWRLSPARAAMLTGVGVAAIGGYAGLNIGGASSGMASAIAQTMGLPDPMSILSARSPGGRPAGAMFNTKPNKPPLHRLVTRTPPPRERMLTTVRERTPVGWTPPFVDLPDPSFGFVPDVALPLTPVSLGSLVPGGNPGGFVVGVPPVFPGGGNDPNDPVVPPPTTIDPPPVITPVVPEPATWAMMILGFLLVGAALRRAPRRRAKDGATAA